MVLRAARSGLLLISVPYTYQLVFKHDLNDFIKSSNKGLIMSMIVHEAIQAGMYPDPGVHSHSNKKGVPGNHSISLLTFLVAAFKRTTYPVHSFRLLHRGVCSSFVPRLSRTSHVLGLLIHTSRSARAFAYLSFSIFSI